MSTLQHDHIYNFSLPSCWPREAGYATHSHPLSRPNNLYKVEESTLSKAKVSLTKSPWLHPPPQSSPAKDVALNTSQRLQPTCCLTGWWVSGGKNPRITAQLLNQESLHPTWVSTNLSAVKRGGKKKKPWWWERGLSCPPVRWQFFTTYLHGVPFWAFQVSTWKQLPWGADSRTPSTPRTKDSIVLQSTEENSNSLRSKRAETREKDPWRNLLDVNVDCLQVHLYQELQVFSDRREAQS